ncbi:MAG: amidohydrolase family protein, partial [Dehalococcoidia bacterium]
CQRHPGLKFVLAEAGIGWLPWLLVQMDDNHHRRHMWEVPQLELLPSEYFKRQGYSTFADDIVGIMTREITGVDSLMWGSDYPHDEGTFPHSQEVIERTFKGVSQEDKRKIVCENAARLYGFIN